MTILVTGAGGNIGSSTVEMLVNRGYRVRALTAKGKSRLPAHLQNHMQVELYAGDVRDAARMRDAVTGVEAVIHLAYIIPPDSNENPQLAREVNLDGTRNLLDACLAQPRPPRFLFASTFDLFGHTTHLQPPRRLSDPVHVTDLYTEHKMLGEQWVKESGLQWSIFRFADVPLMGFRSPHPIMFEIPLSQRFEVLHTRDAGLAIVNALGREAAWNQTWLIGGGKSCQVTYGEFLFGLLNAMGIGELPTQAFTTRPYCTDWLDTEASQNLLQYQQHSFAEIVDEIRWLAGWRRQVIPWVRPLVRSSILRMSPYLRTGAVKPLKAV